MNKDGLIIKNNGETFFRFKDATIPVVLVEDIVDFKYESYFDFLCDYSACRGDDLPFAFYSADSGTIPSIYDVDDFDCFIKFANKTNTFEKLLKWLKKETQHYKSIDDYYDFNSNDQETKAEVEKLTTDNFNNLEKKCASFEGDKDCDFYLKGFGNDIDTFSFLLLDEPCENICINAIATKIMLSDNVDKILTAHIFKEKDIVKCLITVAEILSYPDYVKW